MSILIGHASGDERGRASGGAAGDQTGKEVCIRFWYASGWNIVLRPTNPKEAEAMAQACEVICKGNLVGYDQGQRNTLWDELEKVGWDPAKLKTKCETDCSAFMSVCAKAAGIDIARVAMGGGLYNCPYTGNMRTLFMLTGHFQLLTDQKYLISDKYLLRGDVLVRESGHTAMALGNGELSGMPNVTADAPATAATPTAATAPAASRKTIKATEPAHYFDRSLAGTYECTATALNVRNGSGTTAKALTQLKKGDRVNCYGYYNAVDSVKWLYIQFTQGNVTYTAFASSKYLTKV